MIWFVALCVVWASLCWRPDHGWRWRAVPLTAIEWIGLLLVATLWAYRGVWTAGWVYEDVQWLPTLAPLPLTHAAAWPYLPWTVARLIGGGHPWAMHGMVLVGHLLVGLLVYHLLRLRVGVPGAVTGLALCWLHPLQTESVAYASGGRMVWATVWFLVALWCAVRPTLRFWTLAAMVGALALSVGSRADAAVGALLLPVGIWILRGRRVWRRSLIGLGLGIGCAGPSIATLWRLQQTEGILHLGGPGWGRSVALTTAALGRYLALVVWPWGFTIDHDWRGLSSGAIALTAGVLGILLIVLASGWRRWPGLAAGGLWVLLALAPRLVVQQTEILNEHQVYLAFLGVWGAIGWAVHRWTSPSLVQDLNMGAGDACIAMGGMVWR